MRTWRNCVDRLEHVDQTTPQSISVFHFTLDLPAQARFGEHAPVNLGVFNLTDKKYWEWADVLGLSPSGTVLDRYTRPGLNVGASVAIEF